MDGSIQQPQDVLRKGALLLQNSAARRSSLLATKTVCEVMRTALGPNSMSKMLVDAFGRIVLTNDGATILKQLDVRHPAAKLLVDIAQTQDSQVGDGTTGVVILAGELLSAAHSLLDRGYHPSIVVASLEHAAHLACKTLNEACSLHESDIAPFFSSSHQPHDHLSAFDTTLHVLASCSLGTKLAVGPWQDHLTTLVVNAVKQSISKIMPHGDDPSEISSKREFSTSQLRNMIHIHKVSEKSAAIDDSRIFSGCAVYAESPIPLSSTASSASVDASSMQSVRVLIVQSLSMPSGPSTVTKLRNATAVIGLQQTEDIHYSALIQHLKTLDVQLVLSKAPITKKCAHALAWAQISAFGSLSVPDMDKLMQCLRGPLTVPAVIMDVLHAPSSSVYTVTSIEWAPISQFGQFRLLMHHESSPLSTILLQGPGTEILAELQRAMHDAVCVVAFYLLNQHESLGIAAGAGASEMTIATALRREASKRSDSLHSTLAAFAAAFESIPRILAENSGADPSLILFKLRQAHAAEDRCFIGISLLGQIADARKLHVLEPLLLKRRAIETAAEACGALLRVDTLLIEKPIQQEVRKKSWTSPTQ